MTEPLPTFANVPLPPPPRPLTAAVQKQAWRELPVRAWTVITLGVLIVILVVGIKGLMQGLGDRALLRDGVRVNAKIESMTGATRNADRAIPRVMRLSYVLPNDPPTAERHELQIDHLTPIQGQPSLVSTGDLIPIIVDPNDRTRWTDRVDPPSWLSAMIVPLLLSPVLLLVGGITLLQLGRIRKLYVNGTATTASVVEVHKSALAPAAKVIKISPVNGGGRVLTLVRPDRLGLPPERGAQLQVIVDNATNPRHAILANAYV